MGRGRQRADEQIAFALAAGATVEAAAERAGVSESTVYRRLQDEDFAGWVDALRGWMLDAAAGELVGAMAAAAVRLRKLVESENEWVALSACRHLLPDVAKALADGKYHRGDYARSFAEGEGGGGGLPDLSHLAHREPALYGRLIGQLLDAENAAERNGKHSTEG